MSEIISIIVPVYNVEQYLNRAVKSILSQTYKDIEVILVDDGSTDRSGLICDKYAETDKRVKVIHKENSGASSARNVGFEKSTGDYILFLDSDDVVDPYMREKLLSKLFREGADLSYYGCVYTSSKWEVKYIPQSSDTYDTEQMLCSLLWNMPFYCIVWNKLFRREMLLDSSSNFIPFPKEVHVGEDMLWLARVLKKANKATPGIGSSILLVSKGGQCYKWKC